MMACDFEVKNGALSTAAPAPLLTDMAMAGARIFGMEQLFTLSGGLRRDPAIEAWFAAPDHELRRMARPWFEAMRACGDDVRELVHDRYPVALVGDAAFGYVNAFTAHANVGFFRGAELADPAGLLEGTGHRMRHVKVRWGEPLNEAALHDLIVTAYRDIRRRLAEGD